ncbi:hypothetical protein [Couchioplanes caeruleus]|uniref:hypothetical protein n=1 Tax=Couchioplanes caeruleus TaxID=56438 RepID=UPI0011607B95|nr:hypothetical protein [Couchioplanes caeruleus]
MPVNPGGSSTNGLPAYTVPPTSGPASSHATSPAQSDSTMPFATQELSRSDATTPFAAQGTTQNDATTPFAAQGTARNDATTPFAAQGTAQNDATTPFAAQGTTQNDATTPFAAQGTAQNDATTPFAAQRATQGAVQGGLHGPSDATMPFAATGSSHAPASFGVGASAGTRQTFGGAGSSMGSPSARPSTYGSGSGQGVPHQRGEGTVYGGLADYAPSDMTMPIMTNPVENSGSLTGHILAQGWRDAPETQRNSNVKVIVAMLLVLAFLVGVSLLFLFTVGDAFSDMIGGVFQG